VSVERRPANGLVPWAARPGSLAATVPETCLMPYRYLAGAERMSVRAANRRIRDPPLGRRLRRFSQHNRKHMTATRRLARLSLADDARKNHFYIRV
jgi:hypothetical protein